MGRKSYGSGGGRHESVSASGAWRHKCTKLCRANLEVLRFVMIKHMQSAEMVMTALQSMCTYMCVYVYITCEYAYISMIIGLVSLTLLVHGYRFVPMCILAYMCVYV